MFNPHNVGVDNTHAMPKRITLEERKVTLKERDVAFRDRLCEHFAADGNQRIGEGGSRRL